MGEPDEMRSGRGEFHEFPYSCVCHKPFKYPDDENNNNEQVTLVSRAYIGSGSEWENKGSNSLQRLKENPGEGPVTLGDTNDDGFLADWKSSGNAVARICFLIWVSVGSDIEAPVC